RARLEREAPPDSEGVHRRAGRPVRVLHQRHDHDQQGAPRAFPEPERSRDQEGPRRQSVSLRDAPADRGRRQARRRPDGEGGLAMLDAPTTRRDFLKGTGALIVSFSLAGPLAEASAQTGAKPVALDEVDSFLTLASTGRVTVYTGKVDLGTGTRTALRQIVAEELDVPLDWIALVEGDTATTPDQGPTWGSLTIQVGGVQ